MLAVMFTCIHGYEVSRITQKVHSEYKTPLSGATIGALAPLPYSHRPHRCISASPSLCSWSKTLVSSGVFMRDISGDDSSPSDLGDAASSPIEEDLGDMKPAVGLSTQKGTRPVTHASRVTPNAQMSAFARRFLCLHAQPICGVISSL